MSCFFGDNRKKKPGIDLPYEEVLKMICKKCRKSIPDSALKCPYCGFRTLNGWKDMGKRTVVKPVKDLVTLPFKKK